MTKIKPDDGFDNFKLMLKEFASSKEIKVKVKRPNKTILFLKNLFSKKEPKYDIEQAKLFTKRAGITKINFDEVKETETANEYKIVLSGKAGDNFNGKYKKISVTFKMRS